MKRFEMICAIALSIGLLIFAVLVSSPPSLRASAAPQAEEQRAEP